MSDDGRIERFLEEDPRALPLGLAAALQPISRTLFLLGQRDAAVTVHMAVGMLTFLHKLMHDEETE